MRLLWLMTGHVKHYGSVPRLEIHIMTSRKFLTSATLATSANFLILICCVVPAIANLHGSVGNSMFFALYVD